jgi:acetyl esterase/lipase
MFAPRVRLVLFVAISALVPSTVTWGQPPAEKKPGPAAKPPAIPANVVIERDVEYGKAGDLPLLLDIVRPKVASEKPLPVIAFIHGGGWRGGSKSGGIGAVMPFVATGNYFGVSIEYRFSNVAIWPAQIHDCKAAIRWIKANAKKYNLDPEKIGVWGSSAGGHLVSMLGVSSGVKELEGCNGSPGQSSQVACVVDFCGPSDFAGVARLKNGAGRGAYGPCCGLVGGPIEEKADLSKAASPLTYVSKDAAAFLIMHGTADNVVPLEQAEVLHAALKKAGADTTLVKIEGGGHGFGGPEVQKRVQNFFEKHLRAQPVEVSGEPISAAPAAKPISAVPGTKK